MADNIQQAIEGAAQSIAKYVDDIATLTVVTQYVRAGANGDVSFDTAKPLARTIIKFDADCETIVPVTSPATGPITVDSALFDLHERNVATATEYRAKVLGALVTALQGWVQAIRT